MKFSPANSKIESLGMVEEIQPYLEDDHKIYSFDLLSGFSCPGACDCLSKVKVKNGKRAIHDGPDTKFRCFSASQEALYTNVYNLRKYNYGHMVEKARTSLDYRFLGRYISSQIPNDLGVCRIHVAGDFFSKIYMMAWAYAAFLNPYKLFYAYTKSLGWWANDQQFFNLENFILTASYGGRQDDLIKSHGLRSAKVVFHPSEAADLGLEIDHDDSHAANPKIRNQDFALLIHGTQPKKSEASKALQVLKKEGVQHAYSRTS